MSNLLRVAVCLALVAIVGCRESSTSADPDSVETVSVRVRVDDTLSGSTCRFWFQHALYAAVSVEIHFDENASHEDHAIGSSLAKGSNWELVVVCVDGSNDEQQRLSRQFTTMNGPVELTVTLGAGAKIEGPPTATSSPTNPTTTKTDPGKTPPTTPATVAGDSYVSKVGADGYRKELILNDDGTMSWRWTADGITAKKRFTGTWTMADGVIYFELDPGFDAEKTKFIFKFGQNNELIIGLIDDAYPYPEVADLYYPL